MLIFIRNIIPSNATLNKYIFKKNLFVNSFFPIWGVFTPVPISSDLKFFYRDLFLNGNESNLNQIVFYKSKSLFFFDEYQRERKFLYTFFQLLSKCSDKNLIIHTGEYKRFKLYISNINFSKEIKIRQIVITRTHGYISKNKEIIELIDYINYA